MSVSFYPAIDDSVAHIITCICEETKFDTTYPDRASAYAAKTSGDLKPNCGDAYCEYLYVNPAIAEPEVNMSNSNAYDLMDVLGLIPEEGNFDDVCVGSMKAEDFLGRVVVARGLAPVSPERLPEQDGIMIYAGRREGYVQERLEQLQEVADWAIANKREVVWG
jgi:hypothetical protein